MGVPVDRDRIALVVSSAIHRCLASRQMTIYPRHRWTRGDQAWDDFIMLEAVHGLVSAVWLQFCVEVGQIGSQNQHRAAQLVRSWAVVPCWLALLLC